MNFIIVKSIAKQIKDKKLSEIPSKINDEIRVDIQQAKNKHIENSELENINISQENKTKNLSEPDSKSEIVIETKISDKEITDEDKSKIDIQSSTQIFEVRNSEITSEINIPKTVIKDANNDLEQNINSNIIDIEKVNYVSKNETKKIENLQIDSKNISVVFLYHQNLKLKDN